MYWSRECERTSVRSIVYAPRLINLECSNVTLDASSATLYTGLTGFCRGPISATPELQSQPQVVVSYTTKYTVANGERFPTIVNLSLEHVPFGSRGPTLAVEDTVSWRQVTLKSCDFSAGSGDCIEHVFDAIRRGKGWSEFQKLEIKGCHLPLRLEQLKLEFGDKLELGDPWK